MTCFAAQALRSLAIEMQSNTAIHAGLAHDLLIQAVPYAGQRALDVIAIECLLVATLDGTSTAHEAYEQACAEMLVPVRTAVIRSDDPLAALQDKIVMLQQAGEANLRTDTESKIRGLVNQARKAFPGMGIKLIAANGRLTITSDLVIRNSGMKVEFASAAMNKLGELLVRCEAELADWAWLQIDRQRNLAVLIVRQGEAYAPRKRRIKSLRHKNQARYEAMSQQDALKLAA